MPRCFNPCFGGGGVGTYGGQDRGAKANLVSILVLVEGGLEQAAARVHPDRERVSILVLVEGGLEPGTTSSTRVSLPKFQSLFWWRGGWNCWRLDQVVGGEGVSILVLVEGGLERENLHRRQHQGDVSILVLVEGGLEHGKAKSRKKCI